MLVVIGVGVYVGVRDSVEVCCSIICCFWSVLVLVLWPVVVLVLVFELVLVLN